MSMRTTRISIYGLTPAILGGRFRDWTLAPDRGRDEGLTSPLPPNWTGGFPASSFPVSGVSARCVPLLPRTRNSGQTCGACQVNFARRVSLRCIASRAQASVCLPFFCPSSCHLPASLGSTLVTRFFATMDALTPVGRFFGPSGHERRVMPDRSPCLPRLHFLPFCLQPPDGDVAALLSLTVSFSTRSLSCWPAPPATARLFPVREAGATGRTSHSARRLVPPSGRIEFTLLIYVVALLRTGSSPPAAPHPVSPRRSSLRSQAGDASA